MCTFRWVREVQCKYMPIFDSCVDEKKLSIWWDVVRILGLASVACSFQTLFCSLGCGLPLWLKEKQMAEQCALEDTLKVFYALGMSAPKGRCLCHKKKTHSLQEMRGAQFEEHCMKTSKVDCSTSVHPHCCLAFSLAPACATGETLNHSVPLSVWRRWQHIAGFHGGLRQVLLVLGHGGANASVLPVEEARAAVLQVLWIVHGGFWR